MKSQENQQTTQKHPKEITSEGSISLGHLSIYKISDNNLFNLLPTDLFLQVLDYFILYELYALKQVCKAWQQTIQSLPSIELLHTYEVSFKDTTLWYYLPAIINDESIAAFAKERLAFLPLSSLLETQLERITTFCPYVLGTTFNNNEFSYKKKVTPEYLIQQAQFIEKSIEQFGQPHAKNCRFNFLWKHYEIELAVFKAYLDLEGILTTLLLLTQLQHNPGIDAVHIICGFTHYQWLRGEDLLFLEIYYLHLLRKMLEQSICLHAYFKENNTLKQIDDPILYNQYQQRLTTVDLLLERLTLSDWLEFLALDEKKGSDKRAALLIEALQTNHPAIPSQFIEPLSLKLTQFKEKEIPPGRSEGQYRKEKVLRSICFDMPNEQVNLRYYKKKLEKETFLQKSNKQLQTAKVLLEQHRKYSQDHQQYLQETEKWIKESGERLRKMQEQLEDTIRKKREQKQAEDKDAQGFFQPLPFSPHSPPVASNTIPAKSALVEKPATSASFDWRSTFKIGGTLLLMLMSVALIITGIGSLMGLSLLIALSLPLFAKVLLLTAGGITFLASIAISICIGCSTKNISRNRQISVVPDKQPPATPSEIVSGHTSRMIQTFNQIPSSSQQEDIHVEGQDTSNLQYSSPLTQPYSIPPRNEIPQTMAVPQQDPKDGLNTQNTYNL